MARIIAAAQSLGRGRRIQVNARPRHSVRPTNKKGTSGIRNRPASVNGQIKSSAQVL